MEISCDEFSVVGFSRFFDGSAFVSSKIVDKLQRERLWRRGGRCGIFQRKKDIFLKTLFKGGDG